MTIGHRIVRVIRHFVYAAVRIELIERSTVATIIVALGIIIIDMASTIAMIIFIITSIIIITVTSYRPRICWA